MRETLALRAPAGLRLGHCSADEAARLIENGLDAWLTSAEREQWRALGSPKRRLDWVCGRVAAKRALGSPDAEVFNEPSGRPYCRRGDGPVRSISISHCAEGGVCAASDGSAPIGVDYETVSEREDRLLEMYLHAQEREGARGAEDHTALWSLKEAVLKLLGLGLSGGLTDVRFSSPHAGVPALFGAAQQRWRELGGPIIETSWRREGPAVLALAYCGQGA